MPETGADQGRGHWRLHRQERQAFEDKYSAIIGVKIYPHWLRQTMAKRFLQDNANDLVSLGQIPGHESLNTTRRYSLKSAEDLAQGAERMGW
jgi:site-specific recombinase XerD